MTTRTGDVHVAQITAFEGSLASGEPPFDAADRAAIAMHWTDAVAAKPSLFDGRVLLGVEVAIDDGVLRASYRETSFSAFHWWRACSPGRDLRNVFGAAAVVSSDGAVLLGRMAAHTAPAGRVYFPCGTPDLTDIRGGCVDLDGSIERELEEETGLAAPFVTPGAVRLAVFGPKVCAYVRRYDTALDADGLRNKVEAHLASQERPELDAVILVRSAADIGPASPDYVRIALPYILDDARPSDEPGEAIFPPIGRGRRRPR